MTLNDHFNQLIKNLQFLTKDKLSLNETEFMKTLVRQTQSAICNDDWHEKAFFESSYKIGDKYEQSK